MPPPVVVLQPERRDIAVRERSRSPSDRDHTPRRPISEGGPVPPPSYDVGMALAAPIVVPGHAVGAVALLAARPRVEAVAGRGLVEAGGGRSGGVRYAAAGVTVTYAPAPVDEGVTQEPLATRISTSSTRYRTAGGIGVGSSVAAVRRAYP